MQGDDLLFAGNVVANCCDVVGDRAEASMRVSCAAIVSSVILLAIAAV
jgi:hypothetical protein